MRQMPALARWGVYVAIAIAFAVACAFLSNWQFGRNAGRSAELALVAANYDAAPVPVEQLVPAAGAFDEAAEKWHPVLLSGQYVTGEQLLARNRAHGGTSAFEVLVPFRLDDGRVFLVDRGWVPPGAGDTPEVPAAPEGRVSVVGRLLPGESLPVSGRETAPEGQVPTINLPLVAQRLAQSGAALDQSAYVLMMSEDPAPATAPNALEAPSNDPGPFLSYAIQWILFAVMGFVFIGYVIRTEVLKRREAAAEAAERAAHPEDGPGERKPGPRRRSPFARRPDRDAADEDALLDRVPR